MPYTSLDREIRKKFTEYQQEYDWAECALKEHELVANEGLAVPGVNELRYAGQHVARALAADNAEKAAGCMGDAIKHVRRAEYDAYDAVVQHYLKGCILFREDYKLVPISPTIPTFAEDCIKLAELQDAISREDRKQKEAYVAGKSRQCLEIKQIYRRWDALRDELNKTLAASRHADAYRFWAFIVAVLGLAAAVAAWAI